MTDSVIERQDVDELRRTRLPGFEQFERVGEYSPASVSGATRFGVGFETLDRRMFTPEKVYALLAGSGARYARVQSGWSRCEIERGVYDFAWLDEIVEKLAESGLETYMSVTFGNQLYMPEVPHPSAVGAIPLYYGAEATAAWRRYVEALAEHFVGRVSIWEVWNEPNIPQFWQPAPVSGSDYADLVVLTASAIRTRIPEATIVAGATSLTDPAFLSEALERGMAADIDAFSFHPYQMIPELNLANSVAVMRRLLDRYSNGRRIRLIQGEAGCPSQLSGHHDDWLGMWSMNQVTQAKWVARRLIIDLAFDFEAIFYFHAVDLLEQPYRQGGSKISLPVMMGLIEGESYRPKLSLSVFRRIAGLFDEQTRRVDLMCSFLEPDIEHAPTSDWFASPQVVSFVRDGSPVFAYWMSADAQRPSTLQTVLAELWWDADLALEDPVIVDTVTGDVLAVDRADDLLQRDWRSRGEKYRLPITDYPLVLTSRRLVEAGS